MFPLKIHCHTKSHQKLQSSAAASSFIIPTNLEYDADMATERTNVAFLYPMVDTLSVKDMLTWQLLDDITRLQLL